MSPCHGSESQDCRTFLGRPLWFLLRAGLSVVLDQVSCGFVNMRGANLQAALLLPDPRMWLVCGGKVQHPGPLVPGDGSLLAFADWAA